MNQPPAKPAVPAAAAVAAKKVTLADLDPAEREKLAEQIRTEVRKEEEQKVKDRMSGNGPRYRVEADCYLTGDVHAKAGQEIVYDGQPGPYLTPLNDKAKKVMKDAKLLNEDGSVKFVELVKV